MSNTSTVSRALYIIDLEKNVKGDVLYDEMSLGMYSTDASLYQIIPLAVVVPQDEEDVVTAIKIANDHKIPLLPRGGGTSLAGQTVLKGIILDFSKHLNKIIEFDKHHQWVRVQPGLIRDQLNDFLQPHGLIFSPDPATSSRANIGGMVGNNSSGTKSILYGKTIDHVLEMRVALANGDVLDFGPHSNDELEIITSKDDTEGNLYHEISKIIEGHKDDIIQRYPKVMRRVSGYSLDEFVHGQPFNLAKLICGSEGTLATILEVKINLTPLPKRKSVCLAHFSDLISSLRAVQIAVRHQPAAVEILDNELLILARKNIYTKRLLDILDGSPDNVLLIEFYGDSYEEIRKRQKQMIQDLQSAGFGYSFPVFDEGPDYTNVWNIRKKGLGILLGRTTDAKPLPFIEDSAVPVKVLPEYIEEVIGLCAKYDVQAAMYAHASVGVIHVRPILDMRLQEDIDKLKKLSEDTYELVVKYGGSWSGEHGDGLVRSYKNKEFFGPKLYQAFLDIKSIFDPKNIMNPGKIVNAQQIDENLRYGTKYADSQIDTQFKFKKSGGFDKSVHLCSGVGECRKLTGTMCPSFHATRDEEHSTRGRANALRLVMSGQTAGGHMTDDRLLDTLDLCLSCKACKSECPSNVDMAKLKSEVLQMKYDNGDISLREKFISRSAEMAKKLSGHIAPIINFGIKNPLVRWTLDKILHVEKKRVLPTYAKKTFVDWHANESVTNLQGPQVVLFADTYLNYHEPEIGIAAYRLLTGLGFNVTVADVGCCQRPRLSNGFLRDAKVEGNKTVQQLKPYMDKNIPILVCEPSCTSALQDDLPDLIDDNTLADQLSRLVLPIDQFLAKYLDGKKLKTTEKIKYHGHCHQKALYGIDDLSKIFGEENVEIIDSGCCGMAGSFGYEKEHYEMSKVIGEQRLFAAVEKSENECIVANGFSCRHQIDHFTSREARHWLELVDLNAIADSN